MIVFVADPIAEMVGCSVKYRLTRFRPVYRLLKPVWSATQRVTTSQPIGPPQQLTINQVESDPVIKFTSIGADRGII